MTEGQPCDGNHEYPPCACDDCKGGGCCLSPSEKRTSQRESAVEVLVEDTEDYELAILVPVHDVGVSAA